MDGEQSFDRYADDCHDRFNKKLKYAKTTDIDNEIYSIPI